MKYTIVGLALLLAVLSCMYLAKSIFVQFDMYRFSGSCIYLIAFFSLLSYGQSNDRN